MNRAAMGTCFVFAASGAIFGTWVGRIPAIVRQLEITEGELGRALLVLGVGSLVSMPFTGRVCRRIGSRAWVAITAVFATAALAACGYAPSLTTLTAAMFVQGLAFGSWDVAMNVQGSAVDRRAGREWMPRYHACWSLGSIAGAAAGSVAARAGIGPGPHLAIAAVVVLVTAYAGLTQYIDERPDERAADAAREASAADSATASVSNAAIAAESATVVGSNAAVDVESATASVSNAAIAADSATASGSNAAVASGFNAATASGSTAGSDTIAAGGVASGSVVAGTVAGAGGEGGKAKRGWRPSRALVLLGVLTLCSTVAEGAAGDWLALYLDTSRGLTESAAAMGFTVFATAMTVGRFLGTPIAARLGRARAVRIGGLLAVAGVLATVLTPWTPAVYPGALLWALGVCLVFPAAISAAGETERPGDAIALVTTIGYASILIGPPLIGAVADEIGLGRALLGVVLLAAGIVVLSRPSIVEPHKPATAAAR